MLRDASFSDLQSAFQKLTMDQRYIANLEFGKPGPGHFEANIGEHIKELETNLELVRPFIGPETYEVLRIMVHAHDICKAQAREGVSIVHPESHASLAVKFLSEFCNEEQLLLMIQFHDEPFALWRQHSSKGVCDQTRFQDLIQKIEDWDTFLLFNIIDNTTEGKDPKPVLWILNEVKEQVDLKLDLNRILVHVRASRGLDS